MYNEDNTMAPWAQPGAETMGGMGAGGIAPMLRALLGQPGSPGGVSTPPPTGVGAQGVPSMPSPASSPGAFTNPVNPATSAPPAVTPSAASSPVDTSSLSPAAAAGALSGGSAVAPAPGPTLGPAASDPGIPGATPSASPTGGATPPTAQSQMPIGGFMNMQPQGALQMLGQQGAGNPTMNALFSQPPNPWGSLGGGM